MTVASVLILIAIALATFCCWQRSTQQRATMKQVKNNDIGVQL
jgi:hypothetical protein